MSKTELFFEISAFLMGCVSLAFTIYLPILIHRIDTEYKKREKNKEVLLSAKKFIQDNAEELHYLYLCKIASSSYFKVKHVRKIYNEFTLLEDDVKRKVLELNDLSTDLINEKNDNWISSKIENLLDIFKKLKLGGKDYLDNDSKFLKNILEYKNILVNNFNLEERLYYNIFDYEYKFYDQRNNITFYEYLKRYIDVNLNHKEKIKDKNIPLPLDYLAGQVIFERYGGLNTAFYLNVFIDYLMDLSCVYFNHKQNATIDKEAKILTLEDLYFKVLYKLYNLQ